MPLVFGQCLFGSLLCSDRHHRIRSIISDGIRKISKLKVFEDVTSVVDCGSMMRCENIVLNRIDAKIIADPTIRFKIECSQSEDVNKEKVEINIRVIRPENITSLKITLTTLK